MASENNNAPKKFSWGIKAYIALVFMVLYLLYPKSSGDMGSFGDIFLSFFITLGIVVGLFTFFWWKTKKKTIVDPEKKETKISSGSKKTTLWSDRKTWAMIALGYILWGIGQSLCIMNSGPFHPPIIPLPSGMFYLPYSGIFYAVLLSVFFYLGIHSKNALVLVFSFFFGGVCSLVSIWSFWFVPYSSPHLVRIPVLQHIGILGIPFSSDPVISWGWIVVTVLFLYVVARIIGQKEKDYSFSEVLGNIVLITAVSIFLPQLLYL
ncbi:MAG: hypothetical protein NT098_05900 [Candidatus Parcubacteria bacterium]|nr:hypothetical protein [Candidatus Parcubacteria bacterium]